MCVWASAQLAPFLCLKQFPSEYLLLQYAHARPDRNFRTLLLPNCVVHVLLCHQNLYRSRLPFTRRPVSQVRKCVSTRHFPSRLGTTAVPHGTPQRLQRLTAPAAPAAPLGTAQKPHQSHHHSAKAHCIAVLWTDDLTRYLVAPKSHCPRGRPNPAAACPPRYPSLRARTASTSPPPHPDPTRSRPATLARTKKLDLSRFDPSRVPYSRTEGKQARTFCLSPPRLAAEAQGRLQQGDQAQHRGAFAYKPTGSRSRVRSGQVRSGQVRSLVRLRQRHHNTIVFLFCKCIAPSLPSAPPPSSPPRDPPPSCAETP